jgi:hypothetical protein
MKAAKAAAVEAAKTAAMEAAAASGEAAAVEAAPTAAPMKAATAATAASTPAVRGIGEIRRRQRRDAQQCGREKSHCPADAGRSAKRLRGNRDAADTVLVHEDLLLCVGRPSGRLRQHKLRSADGVSFAGP